MTLGSHCLPNRTVGTLGLQKKNFVFTLEGNESKLEIARFKGDNSCGLLMTLLTSGLQSLAWEVRDHTLPHRARAVTSPQPTAQEPRVRRR